MFISNDELGGIYSNIDLLKEAVGEEKQSLYNVMSLYYGSQHVRNKATGLFKKIEDVEDKLNKVIEYLGIEWKESKQSKAKFIKVKK